MFHKNWFYRKDSQVRIDIESGLNVQKSVYPLAFNCNDENYAELLKDRLNDELALAKKIIAKEALIYLKPEEISELKKTLYCWNSKEHHWK